MTTPLFSRRPAPSIQRARLLAALQQGPLYDHDAAILGIPDIEGRIAELCADGWRIQRKTMPPLFPVASPVAVWELQGRAYGEVAEAPQDGEGGPCE